jgi:hypothetical protein
MTNLLCSSILISRALEYTVLLGIYAMTLINLYQLALNGSAN